MEFLRESEGHLRVLTAALPQLIWTALPDGMVDYVNERWLKYTGLAQSQVLGAGWLQAVHPDDVAATTAAWKQSVRDGVDFQVEQRLRSADGNYRWYLARAIPQHDETGHVIRWFGSNTDIEAQKQSHQTLVEHAGNLQEQTELLDMAHDAIVVRSMAGEISYWNRGAEATYGWSKAEAVGKVAHVLLRTHFSRPLPQIENHLLRHGRWEGTLVQYKRGNERRMIASRWALKRDERGNPVRVLEINTDITERRQAEDSLQFLADASETLATLVDYNTVLRQVAQLAVPFLADWCVVFHEHEDGKVERVAFSHAVAAKREILEQIKRQHPYGQQAPPLLRRVLRDGQAELVPDVTERVLSLMTVNEEHRRLVRELQCRSLMCLPLTVRGRVAGAFMLVTDHSGKRYGMHDLAIAEELAHRAAVAMENAQLYAEAREADQRKDEFLATLAHELRNPLAPIRNAVQLMRVRKVDDPEINWARDAIDRQVQQLTRLVDDLLDVSRITRGKIELRKEVVDVAGIVGRAVETSRPLIDQLGHRLEVSVPDETIRLEADPTRLEQVLANLLNNAAKYTPPKGRIWLSVEATVDEAVLRVRDTGIGMTAEFLPRVFDMFVQAEHHHGRAQGGLGIGLSLVRSLVNMHGGEITAYSAGPDQGCEFTLRLPRLPMANPDQSQTVQRIDVPTANQRKKILIVDDNVDAALSLAMLLRVLGNETQTAHDGESALLKLDEFWPDLVFLDIGLPRMNGYEVAQNIRQRPRGSQLHLVALTGWGQEDDRRRSREAGFDDHLTKPVDQATLQRILAQPAASRVHRTNGNSLPAPAASDGKSSASDAS